MVFQSIISLHLIVFLAPAVCLVPASVAQVADSSYQSDVIHHNPAAILSRKGQVFSVSTSAKHEKVSFDSPGSVPSSDRKEIWKTTILKNRVYFATDEKDLGFEVLMPFDSSVRSVEFSNSDPSSESKYKVAGGQANVAYQLSRSLRLGVQGISQEYTQNFSSGESSGSTSGAGVGLGLGFNDSTWMGLTHRKLKISGSYTSGDGQKQDFSGELQQSMLGLSYTRGQRSQNSLRAEISMGWIPISGPEVEYYGTSQFQQTRFALEGSWTWFLAGVSASLTRGIYRTFDNEIDIATYGFDQPRDEAVLSYDGFFSLRSKRGHSFGGSLMVINTSNQPMYIQGAVRKVALNTSSLGFSYGFAW